MHLLVRLGIVILVTVSCCQGQSSDPTVGATPENLAAVSQSVTNLAQKISLAIANPKSKTEIFSPVSIAGALSLLLLGSGGATRDELMNVMGFQNTRLTFTDIHKSFGRLFQDLVSNDPNQNVSIPWRLNDKCNNYDYDEEDYDQQRPVSQQRGKRDTDSHFISVANGVFVDQSLPLNLRYVNLTKTLYAGEISPMSLYSDPVGAANYINSWVQRATWNKIQQIVSPDQVNNAPMVLASALYFKAKWETMFVEQDTRPRQYFLNGRNKAPIDVEMMATSGCFPFYEDKQLDAKIFGLPYQEGKSTMYIIMPNESDRQKVKNVQSMLYTSPQYWDDLINQMVVKTGTILLPKMKIENALSLRDVLVSLNLRDVFNAERSDLTAITKDDPILNEMNQLPAKAQNPVFRPPSTTRRTINRVQNTIRTTPPPKWVPMSLRVAECGMIESCIYENNICYCAPSQSVRDRGCESKPFVAQYNCHQDRLLLSTGNVQVCLVDWYRKDRSCQGNCYKWQGECFCCSQQLTNNGQAVRENQQTTTTTQPSEEPSIPGGIGIRISEEEPPSYTTTRVPYVQVCQRCYGFACWYTYCSLDNNRRRNKRQTARNTLSAKLYVGDIIHKVSLDVNEQGTEGGAVTAVVVDRISSSFNLRVNGPFLIYLRNEVTKLPLFYGAVFDPRP